jgi:hypothetical protein
MKFRPVLVHSCFDQSLGEPRPASCRCRYRIAVEEAKQYVADGRADWIIVDWRNGFPVEGSNLVWGARPTNDELEVRSAYAKQTPRVQTIEKAHIERAYISGRKEDIARIEDWGRLQIQLWAGLMAPFVPDPCGDGRPILIVFEDFRTSIGKTVMQS